jgi:hypothetical protein
MTMVTVMSRGKPHGEKEYTRAASWRQAILKACGPAGKND